MESRVKCIISLIVILLLTACASHPTQDDGGATNPALSESVNTQPGNETLTVNGNTDTEGSICPTEESIVTQPIEESGDTLPSVAFDISDVTMDGENYVVGPYTFQYVTLSINNETITGLELISCEAGVEKAVIPSEVNGIPVISIENPDWASVFRDTASIRSVVLPETICYIGHRAFYGCANLTDLVLSSEIKYIGTEAFYDCPGLKKMQVRADMTLAFCALDHAVNLEEIVFDDGYDYNEGFYLSFSNCIKLTSVYLPDSITSYVAFMGCSSLTDIRISGGIDELNYFPLVKGTAVTFLELPEGLTHIGLRVLEDSSLKSIVIPSTLENIDGGALDNCPLKEVFYRGTAEQCPQTLLDRVAETEATIYYLSETEPTEEGNFWHYVDGQPVIW